eukprot:TRINITY_DN311_c0_g1_i1.p1 TRINITY_DN311_c0_g1~~TRINITY_DN311_c0_g1_i1.p1  ORF type:complete len:745 (+),score=83.48 TRINITY_DN311_c0_g1_i1:559-2793(+)
MYSSVQYSLQGLVSTNPYMCLTAGTIYLAIVPIVYAGYETFSRIVLAVTYFVYCWMLIIFQRDFITGPCAVATTTFFFIPMIYFFDRKGQMVSCVLIVICNILLAYIFVNYFPETKDLVLKPKDINMGVCTDVLGMSVYLFTMIYFNSLSNKVYEDVKATNERIETSSKEKEEFFATVSHEIRNPLQSLLGAVELLQDKKLDDSTAQPLLEICKNCCALVINLVSNVLDMSKIAVDKMQLSPVSANLREILRRVVHASQCRASAKDLPLLIFDDGSLPPAIELDTQRIEQIIVNILSNAIKFTNKGKVVIKLGWTPIGELDDPAPVVNELLSRSSWKENIELSEKSNAPGSQGLAEKYLKPHYPSCKDKFVKIPSEGPLDAEGASHRGTRGVVKLEIMDTGIGISKENAQKLFKQYQQGNASISRRYGGTGLGLWIAKKILLQMKGDIRVKSKEGRGSNFMIAFPAKVTQEMQALSKESGEIRDIEQLKGKTYLLLDDIPENMFVLKERLNRYGINSITRQNGIEALEVYKAHPKIDAIITDLRMPLMSGQAFISEVRKYEREANFPATPIVVLTAETSLEEKKLCLTQYGANDFLLKPVKQQDLISTLLKVHSENKRQIHKKILVVDDDVISSKFMTTVLSKNGHACMEAHSISEAKQVFTEHHAEIDVMVLDNLLGDGTGLDFFEFASGVIANGNQRMPAVISISGNPVAEQKDMYGQRKVDGFLQKPVRKRDLLEIMEVIQ